MKTPFEQTEIAAGFLREEPAVEWGKLVTAKIRFGIVETMTLLLADRESRRAGSDTLPLVEEIPWLASVPDLFRAVTKLPCPIFFDSARFDRTLGRYSFLAAAPFETIRSRNGFVEVRNGRGEVLASGQADPFEVLAERLGRYRVDRVDGPPWQGGAAGLLSYDLCHHLEKLPRPKFSEFDVPDMMVGLYDWVIALDHLRERAWVVSTGRPGSGPEGQVHARRQLDRVRRLCDSCRRGDSPDGLAERRPGETDQSSNSTWRDQSPIGPAHLAPQFPLRHGPAALTSNFSRELYFRAVDRAIEYIFAGDVYQVNIAQRLMFPLEEPPAELYLRLRCQNPAPFAGYFDAGDYVIASASPERFLRVADGDVETRPIKGTRPRWPVPEADMLSGLELLESDKDRAENVMIVDLLRNDLGRVCRFGSVRVTDPLRLESYEFVHHLVSEVRARLRPDCGLVDLLRAAFPGGSVTGAPKIRAMEIIAELEPTARGAYCGSLGYIGFDGSMDTSILIRTFTCGRGWLQFPVGGGIVAQSSPEREYEETLHKAEGMIRALVQSSILRRPTS